ncbi:hypothetical protein [Geoalkalibacter sp.]|uniref:hypothetical protein n=1 Tax=Geoalkalibacter sp. TaxID=3041440 RepID=UPI00272EE6AA|nr:hypothetical protein [Geoalkalibacter sp.]
MTHPGSSFAQGPLSGCVDLLSPPAAAPDLVAACVQAPELREFASTPWFPPPPQDDLAAAPLAAGQSFTPDQVQRPTAKTHLTPALPRPPPFAPLS